MLSPALTASSAPAPRTGSTRDLVSYYEETTADYRAWTHAGNMHFGWWRPGTSLLDREAMLEALNEEVFDRLDLD